MSAHAPNLDAYFARIGYSGTREASLESLRALQWHHVRAIPFENLDVLLGRRIRLDLPSIERKLVRDRRGGYCFEQNGLLLAVLRALGFFVSPMIARVRWQVPAEVPTGATHMILRVEIDGRPWLADAGFGSMGLTAPIALDTDAEQKTPHEPRRILRRGSSLVHQARLGDEWSDVYLFTLDEAAPIDFEIGNWFTCSHPESRFMQNLIAARPNHGRRHALMNRELVVRHVDGSVERTEIDTAEKLLAVLASHFDLHFPAGTRFGNDGAPWPR